jgi:hypothetical protein
MLGLPHVAAHARRHVERYAANRFGAMLDCTLNLTFEFIAACGVNYSG